MQAALYDPQDGYYCRTDLVRQGRAGDYRTAPETSPLFAATFARYFAQAYFDLGAPSQWTIAESGAGSGHFARGVLSTLLSIAPEVFAATHYLIDEIGHDARARARAHLAQFEDQVEFRCLHEITAPFECAILFSNELIDAFPVHRVIGRNDSLKELCVGLNQSDDFVWVEGDLDNELSEYCARVELSLAPGQVHEINLAAEGFVSQAAALLEDGLLITVDYGALRDELLTEPNRFAGTLRAFRRHQFIDDPLANPGQQDLTTTVDWTQMQEAGARSGLEVLRFERLDQFLLKEGLLDVLVTLNSENRDAGEIVKLSAGAREMISPEGLAASFQILVQQKQN